eukprot:515990-Prymnesium_polylepis.1
MAVPIVEHEDAPVVHHVESHRRGDNLVVRVHDAVSLPHAARPELRALGVVAPRRQQLLRLRVHLDSLGVRLDRLLVPPEPVQRGAPARVRLAPAGREVDGALGVVERLAVLLHRAVARRAVRQ